jgi:hypothetical protein
VTDGPKRLRRFSIALLGGLKLGVPADARVTVHGFAIGGRSLERGPGDDSPTGPQISV